MRRVTLKKKYVQELKEYYQGLFDEYGFMRENPTGVLASCEIEEFNKNALSSLLRVILNSDNVSNWTKAYITNFRENIKDVVADSSVKVAYGTVLKCIGKDDEQLENDIGLLPRRLAYNMLESRSEYNESMKEINKKYGCAFEMRDKLLVQIDRTTKARHMDSTDFFLKLNDLEVYLKERFKRVEFMANNDTEFSGYFNYLLSTPDSDDPVIIRDRERLLKFLNGEDIITGYDDSAEFK